MQRDSASRITAPSSRNGKVADAAPGTIALAVSHKYVAGRGAASSCCASTRMQCYLSVIRPCVEHRMSCVCTQWMPFHRLSAIHFTEVGR